MNILFILIAIWRSFLPSCFDLKKKKTVFNNYRTIKGVCTYINSKNYANIMINFDTLKILN